MKNYRIRKLIDGRYVAEVNTGWWIFEEWKPLDELGRTDAYWFHKDSGTAVSLKEAKRRLAEYGISE